MEQARAAFATSKLLADQRKGIDRAYSDYLVAYELVVNVIPAHRDFLERIENLGCALHRQYRTLSAQLNDNEEKFFNIKKIIQADNARNGTQSNPASMRAVSQRSHHDEWPSFRSRPASPNGLARRDDELMLPPAPSTNSSAQSGRASPVPSTSPRRKPVPQPKPPSLHGQALHHNAASAAGIPDDLVERFTRLKGASAPIDTSVSSHRQPDIRMPSPTQYQSANRPSGPRDMPSRPNIAPPQPQPRPLNTQIAFMPKEPSPTYSPARNLSMPAEINPPRSTVRSMFGTGGRTNSMASVHRSDSEAQFSLPRRKSVTNRPETHISNEQLYDYLRMYNVLLIDVRSREDFDGGHIYWNSIMCVEPAALQDGGSAEQLAERLVLSPDDEQEMFSRRDEYDLVVYYDDCTESMSFLSRPPRNERELALGRLYNTLYNFNQDKPLQLPPILLEGGLVAWASLVGQQALKLSSTCASVPRGARPPPSSGHGSVGHRRRLREYAPMDPDEEARWLEEARRGRRVLSSSPVLEPQEMDDMDPSDSGDIVPQDHHSQRQSSAAPSKHVNGQHRFEPDDVPSLVRSPSEFVRRYPEVDVERQSMVYPTHDSAPLQRPRPNDVPAPPSRPAPSLPRLSYGGVGQRVVTPNNVQPVQPPVYRRPNTYARLRLPRTGLVNFGVTCYMNATIQCLNATIPMTTMFLQDWFVGHIQRENWKGTKGVLTENYATLIRDLWHGAVSAERLARFRALCARLNSGWGTEVQQDAKEFLEFLLDALHEDMNVVWARTPLRDLTPDQEARREQHPTILAACAEWARYCHRQKSVIQDLFTGQHASRICCLTCRRTSTTFEAFNSLSVQIPSDRSTDLQSCLRAYCTTETLAGDDMWACPGCKERRVATKTLTLTRAPDVLVVHFKRFSAVPGRQAKKVHTVVDFPLQGLDLEPHMQPRLTAADEGLAGSYRGPAAGGQPPMPNQVDGFVPTVKTDPAINGPFKYNAFAVLRHLGTTLTAGHYVACVKDRAKGCWVRFNDDRVTEFEPAQLSRRDRLQNKEAYLVFYERERVAGGAA